MFCDYATLPSVSLCNMVTCAHCATPQNKRRSFVAPGLPDTCQDLCSVISTQAHEFQEIAKHWNCLFSSILLCNEMLSPLSGEKALTTPNPVLTYFSIISMFALMVVMNNTPPNNKIQKKSMSFI